MTPNFIADVKALMPRCCHIGSGIPFLHIFVVKTGPLLGTITVKWMRNFIACELLTQRVVTFDCIITIMILKFYSPFCGIVEW